MNIMELLTRATLLGASDLLLIAGLPAAFKVNGVITREGDRLYDTDLDGLVDEIYLLAGNRSTERLTSTGDDDFSFGLPGLARFRVNALRQRGSLALVIRVVSFTLPSAEELGVPENVMRFGDLTHGLVLFTGPAGSGKTTTLACIVERINTTRNAHIITIEDPIEYLHQHKTSVVTQRELYIDTMSYPAALRAALREAPDVVLLGEMRDEETIRAAVTAAETGHLVFSTLHTVGAANTIDRIVDSFDPRQQTQIRTQLALVLEGVVSQQLVHSRDGGLIPAFEVMRGNSAVRTMIRESKAHQLDNLISTSSGEGMVTMDQSLLALVADKKVTAEEALGYCVNPEYFKKRVEDLEKA
ncbi:MAG: PilT/PilU family type 4a pilus ATPase [Oscillospiraceae bacterium]